MTIKSSKVIIFILTVFCYAVLSVYCTGHTSSAETRATITLSDKKVSSGDTVQISVKISNNSGIANMRLSLQYDNSVMTLTDVQEGQALSSLDYITTDPDTELGYSITPFMLMWDGLDNDSSSGTLAVLTFKIADNAPKGSYIVTFNYGLGDISYRVGDDYSNTTVFVDSAIITVTIIGDNDEPDDERTSTVAIVVLSAVGGTGIIGVIVCLVLRAKKIKENKAKRNENKRKKS